jgi:hypothetical protein
MDTRRDSDPAVKRPTADRDGRALRAVEPTEPLQVDGVDLLRDAAALLTARQELDALLVQLATAPFSGAAYDGLRAYLAGSGQRAQAAYARVCASTGTTGR